MQALIIVKILYDTSVPIDINAQSYVRFCNGWYSSYAMVNYTTVGMGQVGLCGKHSKLYNTQYISR